MMQIFTKRVISNKRGFTLVELMIVIAIIGLLSVVLVPKIGRSKDAAKNAGVEANMKTAMNEIVQIIDNYTSPVNLETAIQLRLNNLLTNPYNGASTAIGFNVAGNSAVKTHWDNSNPAQHTLAKNDEWFAQGPAGIVRTNCAGTVVVGLTYVNNALGVAIYGFDGAGNPITPSTKALRISQ